MTRPLRVDVADGWYHVISRGIERRDIFINDSEHTHFCELLAEMVDRFRVLVHSHVELDNHYHLIVQTPEANLSKAIQWLNVSYVAWVNRRRDRVGPLMQGRFKSVPVEDGAWAYDLSVYLHLNPVMRQVYGLTKDEKKAESQGWLVPDEQTVTKRLAALRQYRWSSYRAYAGYVKPPEWLCTREILRRASRKKTEREERYREDVRQRIAKGVDALLRERLADNFALGGENFRKRVRELANGGRDILGTGNLRQRASFGEILAMIEQLRKEKFETFVLKRGDWAKPLLLWALRRYSGMTLSEIGLAVGGMDYAAVAMAIKRFEKKAENEPHLRKQMEWVTGVLNVKT